MKKICLRFFLINIITVMLVQETHCSNSIKPVYSPPVHMNSVFNYKAEDGRDTIDEGRLKYYPINKQERPIYIYYLKRKKHPYTGYSSWIADGKVEAKEAMAGILVSFLGGSSQRKFAGKYVSHFKDGLREGLQKTYTKNGKKYFLSQERDYRKGECIGSVHYDYDGNVVKKNTIEDGRLTKAILYKLKTNRENSANSPKTYKYKEIIYQNKDLSNEKYYTEQGVLIKIKTQFNGAINGTFIDYELGKDSTVIEFVNSKWTGNYYMRSYRIDRETHEWGHKTVYGKYNEMHNKEGKWVEIIRGVKKSAIFQNGEQITDWSTEDLE